MPSANASIKTNAIAGAVALRMQGLKPGRKHKKMSRSALNKFYKQMEKERVNIKGEELGSFGIWLLGRKFQRKETKQLKNKDLEWLLSFANHWAKEVNHPEVHNREYPSIITPWGEGYKEACKDFYDAIDARIKHRKPRS